MAGASSWPRTGWRLRLSTVIAILALAASLLYISPTGLGVTIFGTTSTMAIQNVAVAGGTGSLGSKIVEELVKAGFTVTLLSRDASKVTVPAGVKEAKTVDYTSVDSLKTALAGQDAVVSVLASLAVGGQNPLIDAAVASGVQRFLPSEFGVNTRTLQSEALTKILGGKIKTLDYLIEKANASGGKFSWTGISTGLFFDWGLEKGGGGVGLDRTTKTATIFDSGNEKFPSSNLNHIGRGVAAVLKQAGGPSDKTANKYISIASFTPTQNELLKLAETETGAKWTVNHQKAADSRKTGEEKLAKGDFSAFPDLLRAYLYEDGAGRADTSGNELIGLPLEDPSVELKKWLNGSKL